MLCVVVIPLAKITYENTQRFSISRSIGPGKHTFLPEFFSCRAGVKPFGRAGYAVELPLFILHIVNSTRCSMAKVVRVWRMRNRQITDSCIRFTDCVPRPGGSAGVSGQIAAAKTTCMYMSKRYIGEKFFLFFLRKQQ